MLWRFEKALRAFFASSCEYWSVDFFSTYRCHADREPGHHYCAKHAAKERDDLRAMLQASNPENFS